VAGREVKVALIGDASRLKAAMKEAETATGTLGKAQDHMSGLAKLAMAGAVTAVVAFAKKSVDSYMTAGAEVLKLTRLTGASAEEMSVLRGAAELTGTDIDSLGKAMGKLSKAIIAHKDTVADFGFASRDASGNLLPLNDTLMNVAERFRTMAPGVERNNAALKLFGRNGLEMMPFLIRGKDGLKALEDKARSLGIAMSGADLEAVKKYKLEQRELGVAAEGLSMKLGSVLVPALTKVADFALKGVSALQYFTNAMNTPEMVLAKNKLLGSSYDQLTQTIANEKDMVKRLQDEKMFAAPWDLLSIKNAQDAAAGLAKQAQALRGMTDATVIAVNEQATRRGVQDADRDGILRWLEAQSKVGVTYDDASVAAAAYIEWVKSGKKALEDHKTSVQEDDAALKTLTDDLKAQFDPLFGMLDAQKKLNDANWAAAVALKEHGKNSSEYRDAVETAAKAAVDMTVAQETLSEKVKTGAVSLDDATRQLDIWVGQGIITTATADAMKQKFNDAAWAATVLHGTDASVQLNPDQLQHALDLLQQFSDKMAGLAKMGLVTVFNRQLKDPGMRASGGPVDAGVPYLVGELGPELIVPRQNGTVITAAQTQTIMNGGQGAGTGTQTGWGTGDIVLKLDGHEFMRWLKKRDGGLS
jgi:cbb3-type cytochrome oxidase cytochrome c subunit